MSEEKILRRVLVSGAAGFIGSRVVRALSARGYMITALVRPGSSRDRLVGLDTSIEVKEANFHESSAVKKVFESAQPEVMIHAGWHAEPGNYLQHLGNIADLQSSLDLFRIAAQCGCRRIVGIGTCLEYETARGYLSEDAPLDPRSLYASAKAALYFAASAWARGEGVSFAWARLFYQFGPGEDPRRLVPSVVSALRAGRIIATTSGEQIRDYLHVDDVAEALALVAMSETTGPINIGSGQPIRVRDLISLVESQMGRDNLVHYGERPNPANDPQFICANPTRLRKEIGWQPNRTLKDGIADTIHWWKSRTP